MRVRIIYKILIDIKIIKSRYHDFQGIAIYDLSPSDTKLKSFATIFIHEEIINIGFSL